METGFVLVSLIDPETFLDQVETVIINKVQCQANESVGH